MGKLMLGYVAIAFPVLAILFGMFAMGVITFRKPSPPETPAKPTNLRPPPQPHPKKPPPELTEKEKRRAERRAKKHEL
jgi:hypothetical protein